jgi:diacylglycerol kinase family enzyme
MKATVLLNAAAGSTATAEAADTAARVTESFGRANVEVEVSSVDHEHLPVAAKRAAASNADVVVLGGGDGTLSTGAAALVGRPKPLGVLPLGTFNHFAKDLEIPLDLDRAVDVIAAGHVREVDVGEVNGRVFLNNSSIGLYPAAVDQREGLRLRSGGGKWLAMVKACVAVFRRSPVLAVMIRAQERTAMFTTPFVFVGNNRYDMSLFSLGKRAALDGGELSVYFSRDGGRKGLLCLAFRALVGRLEQDRDFHSLLVPEVEIKTRRRSLRVALDGEVVPMASLIKYRVRPRALRVMAVPPEPASFPT